jgi:hypothetical protein
MPFFIHDEVIGEVRVTERQSIPSDILSYTALALARYFLFTHEGLHAFRLDPERGTDDIGIDRKSALF